MAQPPLLAEEGNSAHSNKPADSFTPCQPWADCRGHVEMSTNLKLLLLSSIVVLFLRPVFGHHSFTAEYDSSKVRQFVGTVTKVEWTNPHARFYLDIKDGQ